MHQGQIETLTAAIKDFNPIGLIIPYALQEYTSQTKAYLERWCREWNFRNGSLSLEVELDKEFPTFGIREVLSEIPNP